MTNSRRIFALSVALSVLFFSEAVYSEDSHTVRYTAEFSAGEFSFDKVMGYDVARMQRCGQLAELGKPMLPSREIRIALPFGMTAESVRIVSATQDQIPGQFNILPAQPPRKIGPSDGDVDFIEPDRDTYQSNRPYPSSTAELAHQTDLAGQGMAVIDIYPLQYVPVEGKLTLYTSITLAIECSPGYECGDYLSPNVSDRGRMALLETITDMVENPGDVRLNTATKAGPSLVPPGGPFDHVIVTSSSYASYFQPLVDWHTRKGVKDTVISTAWIYLNYAGADSQKIRSFVMDANSSWGTTYFLLGGENGTVPFAYRYYYQQSTPSDQYYSDYDDDWTHEVFVGRASVGSTSEVSTFVNKVLKYEKDPPLTDYLEKALLIGMDLDEYTHAEYLKDNIDGSIPPGFSVTKVYDSYVENHRTAVINALNAGQNLVNHADHASETSMGVGWVNHWWDIDRTDVDNLVNNDKMSILVSLSCESNKMDASDCISEHFVLRNPNQAGVAFTGNTRHGWGYFGDPYSLSCALDRQWWVGLFSRNKYNLGQTLVDSKHNFSTSNPDMDLKRHCEWTFNLLGEPEMPIWTDEPSSFDVTHPASLPPGSSSFPVHVEDAATHNSVYQAYVCLWKENEVYLTGYTDLSGDVNFDPSPSTQGTMYVTVTKRNHLPCEQEADVAGYIVGDANGDAIIDIGDVVHLINYLYKNGPAPDPISIGDCNCDLVVDLGDVVHLINYLFKNGPAPGC